jgi:TetR/AcrR family transcriptional regulator, regulator of autoinduction and epiphytic fitness
VTHLVNYCATVAAVKRADRARATRRRIVEAALEQFLEHGYAVTMEAIAERAGVAVQTVYFVFHSKPQLLKEVSFYAAAGEHEPPPVMERPWVAEALAAQSPGAMLDLVVDNGTDIFTRVAPLSPALAAAAAADRELDDYVRSVGAQRHAGLARLVRHAADRGWLRPGLSLERATDIMSAVHHPSVHRILVGERGWTPAEYKAWQKEVLREQLFGSSK